MGYYAFSWVNKTFLTRRFPGVFHVQPGAGAGVRTPSPTPSHSAPGFRRIYGLDKVVLGPFRAARAPAPTRRRKWRQKRRGKRKARRPVSRVLSTPPNKWAGIDGHSSGTPVTGRLTRPTRAAARKPACRNLNFSRAGVPPLFGLAPGGVYPATPVAGGAVRSYRTLSPLPRTGAR